jgi:hypothetical protein
VLHQSEGHPLHAAAIAWLFPRLAAACHQIGREAVEAPVTQQLSEVASCIVLSAHQGGGTAFTEPPPWHLAITEPNSCDHKIRCSYTIFGCQMRDPSGQLQF